MDCAWIRHAVSWGDVRVGTYTGARWGGVEGNDSVADVRRPAHAGATKSAQRGGFEWRDAADADPADRRLREPAARANGARRENRAGSAGQHWRAHRYDDHAVARALRQRAGHSGSRRKTLAADERHSRPAAEHR